MYFGILLNGHRNKDLANWRGTYKYIFFCFKENKTKKIEEERRNKEEKDNSQVHERAYIPQSRKMNFYFYKVALYAYAGVRTYRK